MIMMKRKHFSRRWVLRTFGPILAAGLTLAFVDDGLRKATLPLRAEAHLSDGAPPISSGVTWRVFAAEGGGGGRGDAASLELLHRSDAPRLELSLPAGDYVVSAAYGMAALARAISLRKAISDPLAFVLDAGAVFLDAKSTDGTPLDPERLRFVIFAGQSERALLTAQKAMTYVRLPAGRYRLRGTYGDFSAQAENLLVVEAGKLIESLLIFDLGQLELRAVRELGGAPQLGVSWTVVGPRGEPVAESDAAIARLSLQAGDYTVYARHGERIYKRSLTLEGGEPHALDVLLDRDGQ